MVFAFYHQPPSRQILEKMVVERFPHSFHFSPLDVIAPLKTWGTLLTWTQRNKLKTIGQNIPGPLFETNIKRVVTNEAASHPLDSKHVFILISLVYKMNERCSSELKTSLSLLPSPHFICDRIPTVSRNKKGSLKGLSGARNWRCVKSVRHSDEINVKSQLSAYRRYFDYLLSTDRNISHIWT